MEEDTGSFTIFLFYFISYSTEPRPMRLYKEGTN